MSESIAAELCPLCQASGVIATRTGPTCTHKENTGTKWFPDWWLDGPFENGGEHRRIAFLVQNNAPKSPP